MYTGEADWGQIRRLKQELEIPVIGNGDVRRPADAARMIRETGCDAAMIGRAVLVDPWIFRRTAAHLAAREADAPTFRERRELMLTHFRWIVRDFDEKTALHKLRTFTGRYTHGLPGGRRLRQSIGRLVEPAHFIEAIDEHFARIDPDGEESAA